MPRLNQPPSNDTSTTPIPSNNMATRSTSYSHQRARNDDSWVEISSQPSSSSLSSVADEIVTAGLTVQGPRARRRRVARPALRPGVPVDHHGLSLDHASSQEEYDESESESDRVMSSSGEGLPQLMPAFEEASRHVPYPHRQGHNIHHSPEDDDEERTAIDYPIRDDTCFTPQPNAFSHPPLNRAQHSSQSYFTQQNFAPPPRAESNDHHMPQNILSPSYNPAQQHDEALRASLSTLLSIGAAARGLSKPASNVASADPKQQINTANTARPRSNRIDPTSLRLVPESALSGQQTLPSSTTTREPTFKPTFRRASTSSASSKPPEETKRKAIVRSKSAERRAVKKARRSSSMDELVVTPTLLTWAVSAGVVVALTALSFSAGYSLGKEAGKLEANGLLGSGTETGACAKEVSRSSMGLKRAMARSAVQV